MRWIILMTPCTAFCCFLPQYAVMDEEGIQEGTQHTPLWNTSVQGDVGKCVIFLTSDYVAVVGQEVQNFVQQKESFKPCLKYEEGVLPPE